MCSPTLWTNSSMRLNLMLNYFESFKTHNLSFSLFLLLSNEHFCAFSTKHPNNLFMYSFIPYDSKAYTTLIMYFS
jgi:hypothetical protein